MKKSSINKNTEILIFNQVDKYYIKSNEIIKNINIETIR